MKSAEARALRPSSSPPGKHQLTSAAPMIVLPASPPFVFAGFGKLLEMHRIPRVVVVENELLGGGGPV